MSKLDGWGGYVHNNAANVNVLVGYERGSYESGGGSHVGYAPGGFPKRQSSMITPLLHITLPDDDGEDRHFAPIVLALEAMISVNLWHIRRSLRRAQQGLGNPIAPLYMSGVRYKEDDPGREDWRDCLEIIKRGFGDCDNLCAWRAAELRAAGINAEPVIKWQHIPREVALQLGYPSKIIPPGGLSMVHVLVRHPDGTIEDPSKLLGMGGGYNNRV